MANSMVVTEMKTKVIRAMTEDADLFTALEPSPEKCENGGDLVWNYIFPYNKNPRTIHEVMTFITVMVHTYEHDYNRTFVTPTLEIYIYSHNDHAEMNIKGIKDVRMDFIARLLDDKFNGTSEYGGIGTLHLLSNEEGVYNTDFLYRRLLFETVDLNNSACCRW